LCLRLLMEAREGMIRRGCVSPRDRPIPINIVKLVGDMKDCSSYLLQLGGAFERRVKSVSDAEVK